MRCEIELVILDESVKLNPYLPLPGGCVDVVAWVAPCNMVKDVKSNTGGLTRPTCLEHTDYSGIGLPFLNDIDVQP